MRIPRGNLGIISAGVMIAVGNIAIVDAVSNRSGGLQCMFFLMGVTAIVLALFQVVEVARHRE